MTITGYSDLIGKLRGKFISIPRFGHTNDIAVLASTYKKERLDYIYGIVAFLAFILSIITVWGSLLLLFRCRGSARWGCAAGQFTFKDKASAKRAYWRQSLVQLLFILSSVVVLVMPFVLVRYALPKLDFAVSSMMQLNEDIQSALIESYSLSQSSAETEQKLLKKNFTTIDIRSFCGQSFNETLFLASLATSSSSNETILPHGIDTTGVSIMTNGSIIDKLSLSVDTLKEYLSRFQLEDVRKYLHIAMDTSVTLDNALTTIHDHVWVLKMYGMFFIGFVVILVLIALCNICEKTSASVRTYLYWFLVPVFVLFLCVCWLMSMFVSAAAIVNADFCFGGETMSPESTVLSMMKQRGINEDGLVYKSFLYYQSSCTLPSPWEFLTKYGNDITDGINAAKVVLSNSAQDDINRMTIACGKDMLPLLSDLRYVTNDMSDLVSSLQGALELARCSRVTPIFLRMFDGAICQENIDGLSLSSLAIFCLAVFGMLMVTLRSALYNRVNLSQDACEKNRKDFHTSSKTMSPKSVHSDIMLQVLETNKSLSPRSIKNEIFLQLQNEKSLSPKKSLPDRATTQGSPTMATHVLKAYSLEKSIKPDVSKSRYCTDELNSSSQNELNLPSNPSKSLEMKDMSDSENELDMGNATVEVMFLEDIANMKPMNVIVVQNVPIVDATRVDNLKHEGLYEI